MATKNSPSRLVLAQPALDMINSLRKWTPSELASTGAAEILVRFDQFPAPTKPCS